MPWKGYNFEDAIVISEKVVRDDIFTSIHVDDYSLEVRDTKLGNEELTNDIPNVSEEATKDLDENGMIRIGAEVKPGDILIGKITPKGESDPTPEEKLLRAIFGDKAGDVKDASLKASPSLHGVVLDKKLFARAVKDKKKIELIADRLSRITGQKPAVRRTKKAIATFKTRLGDPIGYQITLRGKRMYEFLDRLINIALPRTKDFRGLSRESVDAMGNYTLGIREHTIFAETSDEDLKDVFGFAVTIVTSSNDKNATLAFLEHIGMPLKKEEEGGERKRGG
jgi:ribosomal protein L5